jgi:hypothetical protein
VVVELAAFTVVVMFIPDESNHILGLDTVSLPEQAEAAELGVIVQTSRQLATAGMFVNVHCVPLDDMLPELQPEPDDVAATV